MCLKVPLSVMTSPSMVSCCIILHFEYHYIDFNQKKPRFFSIFSIMTSRPENFLRQKVWSSTGTTLKMQFQSEVTRFNAAFELPPPLWGREHLLTESLSQNSLFKFYFILFFSRPAWKYLLLDFISFFLRENQFRSYK